MADFAAMAERFFKYYSDKDFESMREMMVPNIDFAHHNRDVKFNNRDELIAVFPAFADTLAPDRCFMPPSRVNVCGNVVYLEHVFTGTATTDIPGFGNAGERFSLQLCSVLRLNDQGLVEEWKDHG